MYIYAVGYEFLSVDSKVCKWTELRRKEEITKLGDLHNGWEKENELVSTRGQPVYPFISIIFLRKE